MSDRLGKILSNIKSGKPVPRVSVREFLSWYDAQRRGQHVVRRIKEDLANKGLNTEPEFEAAWIDGEISFHLAKSNEEKNAFDVASANNELEWVSKDPSHQISKLASANQVVVTVQPNDDISRAVTKMIMHDFSQLPVTNGDRDLRGVISWRTLGVNYAANVKATEVRQVMEPAHEIKASASIFDAISIVSKHDYVVVRSKDQKISGIITATDLTEQFRNLSEPFLLLSEIENHIRNLLGDKFDKEVLQDASHPLSSKTVESPLDMTVGEYIRVLEKGENWDSLALGLDRKYFCDCLNKVREIRNEVMHFDSDGITIQKLDCLRETAGALRKISVCLRSSKK